MEVNKLRTALPLQGLGEPLHVYDSVGSTNDLCRELAEDGAPNGALVLGDEQRHGRGRGNRRWFTPAGSAIAMSLLLRPGPLGQYDLAAVNMLGALAVVEALDRLGVMALIKWPNDVLIEGRKVAGVLTEAAWQGDELEYIVIGIGVNVSRGSLPPQELLDFPAACIEGRLNRPIEREPLILEIIERLAAGLAHLARHELMPLIEQHLAYLGQEIEIDAGHSLTVARMLGLSEDGRLRVQLHSGEEQMIGGDARLRIVDYRDD
jgi:BirA family biotin operon repressor/biotin-[acetyl-CoA-carboxylase] ligase